MSADRRKVLTMLREGKIEVEDAEAMLTYHLVSAGCIKAVTL